MGIVASKMRHRLYAETSVLKLKIWRTSLKEFLQTFLILGNFSNETCVGWEPLLHLVAVLKRKSNGFTGVVVVLPRSSDLLLDESFAYGEYLLLWRQRPH